MDQFRKVRLAMNGLNILQVVMLLVIVLYSVDQSGITGFDRPLVLILISFMVIINVLRGLNDVKQLRSYTIKLAMQEEMLAKSNELNYALRSQRHDFLNHVQVLSTLLELGEVEEAKAYMDTLYQKVKETSAFLTTKNPAINALLRAKYLAAKEQGSMLVADSKTPLENLPMDNWELCKIVSNLVDNGLYATKEEAKPMVRVHFSQEEDNLMIRVSNTGKPVADNLVEKMFRAGVTSKSEEENERGMGLYIVDRLVKEHGGKVTYDHDSNMTHFTVMIPQKEV